MKLREITATLCGALLLALTNGCAHTVPQELADARQAYQQAAAGPASDLSPAKLHDAHQALERAETAFEDEPAAQDTRDLAYIAHRRALLAQADARAEMAARAKVDAERRMGQAQAAALQRTQQELSQTRDQLNQTQTQSQLEAQRLQSETARLQTESQQYQNQAQKLEAERTTMQTQLEQERQARIDAERRADEALAKVKEILAVREEARGTVITIPGSVLFASAQWTLLGTSASKLDQVASALKEMSENRMIVVEGHTDSQGSDAYNQDLSEKRANAVRDYLLTRGVPSERVRSIGFGESRPVASNDNPEGRANNRRVEIVVERDRAAMR